jgi:hypothetical protein
VFHEFLKASIQQFIQLHVAVQGRLFEGAHELGRHAELKRDQLGGTSRTTLP